MKTHTTLELVGKIVRSALISAALLFTMSFTGVVSQAYAWYSCPGGWELQTRGGNNPTGARCLRPESRVGGHPNAGCPVGTTHNVDHRGNTDYCLPFTGSLTNKFSAKCAPGQTVDRRRGGDRCYVVTPPQQGPVNRNVS